MKMEKIEPRKIHKKVHGLTYKAREGNWLPTDFTVGVEFDKDGKLLTINNGVQKWVILVSDIKSLLT